MSPARICLLAMALVHCGVIRAESCIEGVWRGTIGAKPVTLEFPDAEKGGYYYYQTRLVDLALRPIPDHPGSFEEVDAKQVTGTVRLRCEGNSLTGEWASPDGRKHATLAAQKIDSEYSASRLAAVRPKHRRNVRLDAGRYEIVYTPEAAKVEGLRLIGREPGIAEINRQLKEEYLEALAYHVNCKALGQLENWGTSYYETTASVSVWNRKYVVVEHVFESYCGQPHAYDGTDSVVYDLQSGRRQKVSAWLEGGAGDISRYEPLGELLFANYPEEPEEPDSEDNCTSPGSFSGNSATISSEGFVFRSWTPYVSRMCRDIVTIPYVKMQPFLSSAGKAAVKAFLAP